MKLDYTLTTIEERKDFINTLLKTYKPTTKELSIIADYLIVPTTREERKECDFITDNRQTTISKRETSMEGMASKFKSGMDAISSLIANDKNIIFAPAVSISPKDIETIPFLKNLVEAIEQTKARYEKATGKDKAILHKQLKELRKDQYIIKAAYKKPIYCTTLTKSFTSLELDEEIIMDYESGYPIPVMQGKIDLFNPGHISAILTNYTALKHSTEGKFLTDAYHFILDFDALLTRVFKNEPIYNSILNYRLEGYQNQEISDMLMSQYGMTYTPEYISRLWKHKIPKLIAEFAQKEVLE